jgi:hypothetical protein
MKMRVQAQHLQVGDSVGSGETIAKVVVNSISIPTNKVLVILESKDNQRTSYWGKYTMINVERADA